MQSRHRIPTIFNLSMVDVLCCALGCVILLWLLNMREFKVRATAAAETSKLLAAAQADLEQTALAADETRTRLVAAERQAQDTALALRTVRSERDVAMARAEATQKERDQVRRDLDAARARLAELNKEAAALMARHTATEKDLAALKEQNAADAERLAKLSREQRDLAKEKDTVGQRALDLEKLLRDKEALASAAARQADDLAARLRDTEAQMKQLRALGEARAQRVELDLNARMKELADFKRRLAAVQEEKSVLADRARRAQAAVENRFAGMALTGRRVLFLIDKSGSMELLDERTPATDKWTGVRQTVAKIMQSLQDLDKFQIILFSDKLVYPLGSEGQWLDFDARTSVGRVEAAIAAVKPQGNTNVYAGLQAAFRMRPAGLDTIYFLSDGLPNIGEGLSPERARTLKETERSEILSRYIRGVLKGDWNRDLPLQPRVRINTLGFFYESPDVGAFLWALARENEGSFIGMSKP